MLNNYVQSLITPQAEHVVDITNNNDDFNTAVQKYKNVVTH